MSQKCQFAFFCNKNKKKRMSKIRTALKVSMSCKMTGGSSKLKGFAGVAATLQVKLFQSKGSSINDVVAWGGRGFSDDSTKTLVLGGVTIGVWVQNCVTSLLDDTKVIRQLRYVNHKQSYPKFNIKLFSILSGFLIDKIKNLEIMAFKFGNIFAIYCRR